MAHDLDDELRVLVAAMLDEAPAPGPLPHDRAVSPRSRRRTPVLIAVGVAVAVVVAGLVLTTRGDDGTSVRTPPATDPQTTPVDTLSRPVLDGCTPSFATETTIDGSSFSSPPTPTEVFADPARGLDGPLAALIRSPGTGSAPVDDGSGGGKIANDEVHGREASFTLSPNTHGGAPRGGANWDLADGGSAMVYSLGLTLDDLRMFVDAVDSGTPSFPDGLQSIGEATTAHVALSECLEGHDGTTGAITEVQGSLASRYAEMLSLTGDIPLQLIDTNDSSIVIWSVAGNFDPDNRSYHQATPDEWSRLLRAAPQPTGSVPNRPSASGP
jgi:hypothetical protein